jgi:hypothetical protein
MLRSYEQFLESPTRRLFLRLRQQLLRQRAAPIRLEPLVELSAQIREGKLRRAVELADGMSETWLLSPRFHYLRGVAADGLQDTETAELARFEMSACLDGLLATGTGARRQPYIVTYFSDVFDVLTILGTACIQRGGCLNASTPIDVVACDDGIERYFRHPPWVGKPISLKQFDRLVYPLPVLNPSCGVN